MRIFDLWSYENKNIRQYTVRMQCKCCHVVKYQQRGFVPTLPLNNGLIGDSRDVYPWLLWISTTREHCESYYAKGISM